MERRQRRQRRQRPTAREPPASRQRATRGRIGVVPRGVASPPVVPVATLAGLAVGGGLAGVTLVGGPLRERAVEIAALAAVAACLLSALAVAHVVARVGAAWARTGR